MSTVTGICAGAYTYTLLDGNDCPTIATITITQADTLMINQSCSSISSTGQTDGGSSTSVTGGITPYTFVWDNAATTSSITGIGEGFIGVTVTDANNCVVQEACFVNDPTVCSMSITGTVSDLTCNGDNSGSVSANPVAGETPYSYNWISGETTQTITGLSVGNYDVTIIDGVGCTITYGAIVTEPSAIVIGVTVTDILCGGDCTGEIGAVGSGGTGGFSHIWSNGSTGLTATGLCAGTIILTVTDGVGCEASVTLTLIEPPVFGITATAATLVLCDGQSTTISSVISGGTTPYSSTIWGNVGTGLVGNGPHTVTPTAGVLSTYSVSTSDANGCFAGHQTTITVNPALVLGMPAGVAVCIGDTLQACATGTGGTSAITYTWSIGEIDVSDSAVSCSSLIVTVSSTISITLTDGCSTPQTGSFNITMLDATNILCGGVKTKNMSDVNSNIAVYPNPTTGKFTIDFGDQVVNEVTLKDVSGRIVYINNAINSSQLNVELPHIETGMYLLHISNDKGIITRKLLIH